MKGIVYLVVFILIFSDIHAQESKIDDLVYKYLSKFNIESYPDSSIIAIRCMSISKDTVLFGFSLMEDKSLLNMELENDIPFYLYQMKDQNILFIEAINSSKLDESWKLYFDKSKLIEATSEEVLKKVSFLRIGPFDNKYPNLVNDSNCIILHKREIWEVPAPIPVEATE